MNDLKTCLTQNSKNTCYLLRITQKLKGNLLVIIWKNTKTVTPTRPEPNLCYLTSSLLAGRCCTTHSHVVDINNLCTYVLIVEIAPTNAVKVFHHMHTFSDWWVRVTKTQHFWYSNKSTMKDALWKLPKTRGQPEILGTRTREMVPKPNFCYPNPSLWRLVYHSKVWIVR